MEWDGLFQEVLSGFIRPDEAEDFPADQPLVDLGLDSTATIQLMIEIETQFDLVFPDELLTAETFETAGSLWCVVRSLQTDQTEKVDS